MLTAVARSRPRSLQEFKNTHAQLQSRHDRTQVASLLGTAPDVRRAADARQGSEKLYVLDMFPYPSGDGLHVGHPEGYTATDIVCRYRAHAGPAACCTRWASTRSACRPRNTPSRPASIRRESDREEHRDVPPPAQDAGLQLRLGPRAGHDRPRYFRWTQWIFLQIYDTWFDHGAAARPADRRAADSRRRSSAGGDEAVRAYQDEHRLAYQTEAPVNWCPALGTVLANEEVIDGKSERGGHPVVRHAAAAVDAADHRLCRPAGERPGRARLVRGIKALQRNWIGRSTGAEVDFFIGHAEAATGDLSTGRIRGMEGIAPSAAFPASRATTCCGFTRRGPTRCSAPRTWCIAPEHPFVERLTTPDNASRGRRPIATQAAAKSDLDRTELAKEKTGVFTGRYAINPVNGQPVPIWIADYVLISYGTGAIMAVPAHDERDFEFAQQFDLPIIAGRRSGDAVRGGRARRKCLAGERCFAGDGAGRQLGPLRRPADGRVQADRSPPTWPRQGSAARR